MDKAFLNNETRSVYIFENYENNIDQYRNFCLIPPRDFEEIDNLELFLNNNLVDVVHLKLSENVNFEFMKKLNIIEEFVIEIKSEGFDVYENDQVGNLILINRIVSIKSNDLSTNLLRIVSKITLAKINRITKENIDLNFRVNSLSDAILGLKGDTFNNSIKDSRFSFKHKFLIKILEHWYVFLFIILFSLFSLFNIKFDNSVFPWDPAFYAEESLKIVEQIRYGSLQDILNSFQSAVSFKPPLLSWLGVFFLIPSEFFGPQKSLQIGVLFISLFNILVSYRISLYLTQSRVLKSIICIFPFSYSVYFGLYYDYFVEPLQTTIVVLGLYMLIRFFEYRKLNSLIYFTSLFLMGLMVKSTTFIFFIPGYLIILFLILKLKNLHYRFDYRFFLSISIFLSVLVVFSFWYIPNFDTVLKHALGASLGEASLLYGPSASFPQNLNYWTKSISIIQSGTFPYLDYFFAYLLMIVSTLYLINLVLRNRILRLDSLIFMWSFLVITTYIGFLSIQNNRDVRFMFTIIPIISFLIAYILNSLKIPFRILFFVFISLLIIDNIDALHNSSNSTLQRSRSYLEVLDSSTLKLNKLNSIINSTCFSNNSSKLKIVGAETPSLNANTVSFFSQFNRTFNNSPRCNYTSFGYAETSLNNALVRIEDLDVDTIIFDTNFIKSNDVFNSLNFPIYSYISTTDRWKIKRSSEFFDLLIYEKNE
jgi:hypothetical protein